jgi:formate dehydrogenase-N alpha subunit
MTQHWIDIGNSDCIMVIGSNAAENHPVSFKWVQKAKDNGAKLISVDPRFTRTSALADIYSPLRSGTDIAFIGAIINYALENNLIQRDYLVTHTNACFLIDPSYSFDAGMFGEIAEGAYTKAGWGYQKDANGIEIKDKTLSDPNCVFQLLKKHFSRYTLEKASEISGAPVAKIKEVADTYCATCLPDKSATIMYAMGTTQHTHGTQNIRSYVILQLLLGNIGVAGGGINALRGESNVQGSTDHCILFHILPGYLKCPVSTDADLATYLATSTPKTADPKSANWWSNYPKYTVSLLKAFWGDAATPASDFAYSYLPKRGANYSHIALFEAMHAGIIKGMIALGQNPAVGGPSASFEREAIDKLDWLVAVDLWETETAACWNRRNQGQPDGPDPATVQTEVFLLPAAASMEKDGSISNSGRWAQWRYAAVPPSGAAKSDLDILTEIQAELKKLYAEGGVFPQPITELNWNHGTDPYAVAKDINGYFLRDVDLPDKGKSFKKGDLVPSFAFLMDDGATSSGNWLYCASFTNDGNMMARREASKPEDDPIGLNPNWSWCWPVNRRIIYNRASCDAKGVPYAPNKPVVAFDRAANKWVGDVPDGGWPPLEQPDGTPDPAAKYSFIMRAEGHACLFASGLVDGPFPEHYEPLESPVDNAMSGQQNCPVIRIWREDQIGTASEYPIVATTYRVTEHWQAGAMTRNLPWLAELVPEPFVEMSEQLAAEKGISHGDVVTVASARKPEGITLRAMVTKRLQPFDLNGKQVHEVGVIWHFGYSGYTCGASANELTPHVGDANTMIPEFKAFLCDIRKGGQICW